MARETRKAPRRDAALVPTITGVRLSPHGADARLVNISTSGALVESTARLQPGWAVTLQFEGGFQPASVESRIARSTIVAVAAGGRLQYHIGVAFKHPIVLEPLPDTDSLTSKSLQAALLPRLQVAHAAVANRW
jgi:hypothetical protein